MNRYYYSTDGLNFKHFGESYKIRWGGFRGDNSGIFNYNNLSETGFVDVDWFRYSF